MSEIELSREEFEHFRGFVLDHSGIEVGDELSYLVGARMARVAKGAGCQSFRELSALLDRDPGSPLRDQVVEAMVSDETLWYRDRAPWQIVERQLLPAYCRELEEGRRSSVRIWCTSCSTGQEAYSLAISLLEHLRQVEGPGIKEEAFEIVATDISASALYIAISGRYDCLSLSQGLDSEIRDRYFEEDGRLWSISDRVKQRVTFQRSGLLGSFDDFGRFDLVFCRNVLTYFAKETRRDILHRIADALGACGHLIVGSSESIGAARDRYESLRFENQSYYQVQPNGSARASLDAVEE